MELRVIRNRLEEKKGKRDKYLGQKELLLKSLEDQGFETTKKAEIEVQKINKKIDQMNIKYQEGVELFIKKYKDLLD